MPILVNKLIFQIIPAQAPFFIRPLLWIVFGQVDKQLTVPELKKNHDLASPPPPPFATSSHPPFFV